MNFCGIDPGFSGGITIIKENEEPLVYKMPIIEVKKKVKGKGKIKKTYDLLSIRKILLSSLDKKSIFLLERVASMPGEGSVSSFNFGKGFGNLEGVIVGVFNKKPILVSPVTWKKSFPMLNTEEMKKNREEIKKIKALNKELKDKEKEKENKKLIEKLGRRIKSDAKDASRFLASSLFPNLSDKFKLKKSDGLAESLLIAIYGRDNENELVQTI